MAFPARSRTWRHVFISPEINGWTVVFGPSCNPDTQPEVEDWIQCLSGAYGDAHTYSFTRTENGLTLGQPPDNTRTETYLRDPLFPQ